MQDRLSSNGRVRAKPRCADRWEQYALEHKRGDDYFASQRRPVRGVYYWDDGMTLPENVLAQGGQDAEY